MSDYRYRCVLTEELSRVGAAAFASGLAINEDIVSGYLINLGTEEQRRRWLPGIAAGEIITSIAMSEPGVGSDLRGMSTTAPRTARGFVLDGAKTFINNGGSSDVVLVAARTGEHDGRPGSPSSSCRPTPPASPAAASCASSGSTPRTPPSCSSTICSCPSTPSSARRTAGSTTSHNNLPLERPSIAWRGLAGAEAALSWTLDHVHARTAFGQRIIDFQHTRFRLAELVTEMDVTRAYLEKLVLRLNDGHLDATTAAKAK